MTPREFTEFAVNLKGKPIDLSMRPWTWRIYDQPFLQTVSGEYRRKMLMIFGRQCEKSTTIGNTFISACNLTSYLRALYVTASGQQMREFSDERLRAVIADSPKLQRLAGIGWKRKSKGDGRETQNVQTKRWMNKSKITLRSVYLNPDRVRGIPADLLGVDEIQDILTDNLPVIEETLFHSELEGGPISIYAGTPKTFDNSIEVYRGQHSTQNEWLTRCSACRHWNCIERENIAVEGLRCIKCSKPINPLENSQWVRLGRADSEWESYRVPQPIVIYAETGKQAVFDRLWKDLRSKFRYPRAKFENEVMARSFDAGTKPVTFSEVRDCCLSKIHLIQDASEITRSLRSTQTWAGVDWGTGQVSYTILSIWRYDVHGCFFPIFAKRYEGVEADSDFSIQDIVMWCRAFNVRRIGADWGFGFHANPKLFKAFGAAKVLLYSHGGKQGAKVKWDSEALCFRTHRTRVLGDIFELIKRGPRGGGIAFASWDEFETFANDILAVFQQDNERSRELTYDHPRNKPDDFLHSLCFAFLASLIDHPRADLYSPDPSQKDFK